MEATGANVMCFGHTHKPFHRDLSSLTDAGTRSLHAINTGTVGKPKDGDPPGSYVVFTIEQQNNNGEKKSVEVEIIRFADDVEKAARAEEESSLPNEQATMIRQGMSFLIITKLTCF